MPPDEGPALARELAIVLPLRVYLAPDGRRYLTRKAVEGASLIGRGWPGPVTVLAGASPEPFPDFDPLDIDREPLDVSIEVEPIDLAGWRSRLRDAAMVLAFLSRVSAPLAPLCAAMGVPLVYYSEYSLSVEHEIIEATTSNPLRRWRRMLWANRTERIRRAALSLAQGLQCSGVPTYDAYRGLVPETIMFFDNRVRESQIPRPADLDRRLSAMESSGPLRLAFGGRLVAMKGAGHLPDVAGRLRAAGVDFTMRLFGEGELQEEIRQEISRRQLEDRVTLEGVLEFSSEWLPTLREEVDLFVCCHPQGDPSSTYPEVMSCGVPIAGYANSAFKGVLDHGGGGWSVPVNDRDALACLLASLARDRGRIAEVARKALAFGSAHHFEKTYAARRQHLAKLSRLPGVELEKLLA